MISKRRAVSRPRRHDDKVRREKALDFSGCNSRPGTGSLHPVAIDTVIALCDLMMRCNWVKRVLFLADRIALVRQTGNVFKRHLPSSGAVKVLEHPEQIADARVLISTYPAMLRLIDDTKDGRRQFGPGHFDLVIIDEAHRSIWKMASLPMPTAWKRR